MVRPIAPHVQSALTRTAQAKAIKESAQPMPRPATAIQLAAPAKPKKKKGPPLSAAASKRDTFDLHGRDTLADLAKQCDKERECEGKKYDVIDLQQRSRHTPLRLHFEGLFQDLQKAAVNYKNGPLHRNEEKKLPTADSDWRYIECYYVAGGIRLVVDMKPQVALAYVSSHYGVFYLLTDGEQAAVRHNQELLTECEYLSDAYRTDNWSTFAFLYPHKWENDVSAGKAGARPSAAAAGSSAGAAAAARPSASAPAAAAGPGPSAPAAEAKRAPRLPFAVRLANFLERADNEAGPSQPLETPPSVYINLGRRGRRGRIVTG